MHLEIRKPELQALITKRMATGRFRDVEDFLLKAIQSSPEFEPDDDLENASGELLIEMMQKMPYKDVVEFGGYPPRQRKSLAQLFAESPFKGTDMELPRENSPLCEIDL